MIRPSGDGLASQRSGHNNVENLEAKRTYPARNARSAGEIVSLLAFVLDLYSRRVVGWGMSAKPDAELVIKALDRTYEMRGRPQDVLFIAIRVNGCPVSLDHYTMSAGAYETNA